MLRNLPVDTDRLALIATGHVEPVREWIERDGRRQPSEDQSRDEETNLPLWQVHVMIPSGDRPELAAVRVPSREVPQVQQYGPVAFEHLVCRVSVNRQSGQLTGYWSAAGVADPRRHGKPQEQAA